MFRLDSISFDCKILVIRAAIIAISLVAISSCGGSDSPQSVGPTKELVGKAIFFDTNLSSDNNQSCATCHDPDHGFADPRVSDIAPVSEGSVIGQFGNRNAPTVAYASFIPVFRANTTITTVDRTTSNFEGGQFIDGRRDTLEDQAKDPFLNPVEMNNADKAAVVNKVENARYSNAFKLIYGANIFDDVDTAYDQIADAIAAFEKSPEVNPFNSKFDFVMTDTVSFTESEKRGFDLFKGTKAKCSSCHTVKGTNEKSLFTDFRYFNVGTPINPNNPSRNVNPDNGLGSSTRAPNVANPTNEMGKFRTPTLRNIALTAPYMHNGVYKTLKEVITHYDITVSNYEVGFSPVSEEPEVTSNIANELNFGSLTNLGLSVTDSDDLENFMKTLSDGFQP